MTRSGSAEMVERQQHDHGAHAARYLILLKDETVQRAFLFDGDHRYLTELIDDDDLVVEDLIRFGTACPLPGDLALEAVMPAIKPQATDVRCFALG